MVARGEALAQKFQVTRAFHDTVFSKTVAVTDPDAIHRKGIEIAAIFDGNAVTKLHFGQAAQGYGMTTEQQTSLFATGEQSPNGHHTSSEHGTGQVT